MSKDHKIIVIKSPPLGTKEHDDWAKQMVRIQLAHYIDDSATCDHCGYTYKSVDDFMRCNPKRGIGKSKTITFVCASCWDEYEKLTKGKSK